MRRLALLGLLALGACAADQQTASVWQKVDGTRVPPAELQSAKLACGHTTANQVYSQQTPPTTGGSDQWAQENWAMQDSPGYGRMSSAELNSCLESLGYNRVAVPAVGEGSSVPPQQ